MYTLTENFRLRGSGTPEDTAALAEWAAYLSRLGEGDTTPAPLRAGGPDVQVCARTEERADASRHEAWAGLHTTTVEVAPVRTRTPIASASATAAPCAARQMLLQEPGAVERFVYHGLETRVAAVTNPEAMAKIRTTAAAAARNAAHEGATTADAVADVDLAGEEAASAAETAEIDAVARYFLQRSLLAPKLKTVYSLNNYMTTRFPGEGIEALSTDTLLDAEELGMEDGLDGVPQAATNRAVESHRAAVPEEYLNQLTPSGVGPHRLYLKIGMPLICIRNLPDSGLANGTRCILKAADLGAGLLTVQFLEPDGGLRTAFLPRLPTIPRDFDGVDWKRVRQSCHTHGTHHTTPV